MSHFLILFKKQFDPGTFVYHNVGSLLAVVDMFFAHVTRNFTEYTIYRVNEDLSLTEVDKSVLAK